MNIRDLSREVPEYTLPYTIWYSIRNSRQEASGFHFESDVCVRLPIDPLRVSQDLTGSALISLVKSVHEGGGQRSRFIGDTTREDRHWHGRHGARKTMPQGP